MALDGFNSGNLMADEYFSWLEQTYDVNGLLIVPPQGESREQLARVMERVFQAGKAACGQDIADLVEQEIGATKKYASGG